MSEENTNVESGQEGNTDANAEQLADLQRQVEAVNNKNQELLGKLSNASKITEQLNELGGLDRIREVVQSKSSEQNNSQSVIEQKDKYIKELEERVSGFTQSQVNSKVDDHIRSALAEQGLDNRFDLLAPHFKSRVKGELVEGQVRINVLQDDGSTPYLKDGRDASVKDLVEDFSKRESFADLFSRKVTGTGKPANSSNTVEHTDPKSNPFTREGKNIAKQISMWQQDPKKAERLQKEADSLLKG